MTEAFFNAVVIVAATIAGAIASVTGFAIGSLLTPVFSMNMGTKLAVAAVSIPHLVGTSLRLWLLRAQIDRRVMLTFGLTSAAGGLTGAVLHDRASSAGLSIVFGLLLLFVGVTELTGLARRMKFTGPAAWIAGALSGLLGGLVGNQGGIRSAAMLGIDLPREAFVATATAVALIVDGARVPVYLATSGSDVLSQWSTIGLAAVGVLAGTLIGHRLLARIPENRFRPIVAVLLLLLGIAMLASGLL